MNRPSDNADQQAVAEFPELQRLIDLRDGGGWQFLIATNEQNHVTEVRAVRTYPAGYADALMVRSTDDAAALRGDHTGGVVWTQEGSLAEVVDELIVLPAPGTPTAPRLVRATMPKLWTPNG